MYLETSNSSYPFFDIWIEAGPEGKIFTYKNTDRIAIKVGDFVRVRLKRASRIGLTIKSRTKIPSELKFRHLESIESIFEINFIDPNWYSWLYEISIYYHTDFFKILKTAFPWNWSKDDYIKGKTSPLTEAFINLVTERPIDRKAFLTNRQIELINYLRTKSIKNCTSNLLKRQGFSLSTLNALTKKNVIQINLNSNQIIKEKSNWLDSKIKYLRKIFSTEQYIAFRTFEEIGQDKPLLLWGVTGSGKTAIYLQAAAEQLKKGLSVLLLAPEIGLIPQLVDRCQEYLGLEILEYHSGCSKADRITVWRHCYSFASAPTVVVGTRSAVFLPLNPLGLIILDEEHDSSYKQESPMPCYNSRDIALIRRKYHKMKVILGSATPSLETWRSCYGKKKITLARLSKRISGQKLPSVKVVDMRLEFSEGQKGLFSRLLIEKLRTLKISGEQAIILVPRRGHSSFMSCRSCGEVMICPNCDVSLTVHKNEEGNNWLRCHWCDYRSKVAPKCGNCGSSAFKSFGTGTQRVVEGLHQVIENLTLMRFDRDTTPGHNGHRNLLNEFSKGKADVLVGTQMLSKGIDLPNVTLSVVLAADGLLHKPDLRSAEHCLQLLLQLAGRSGRGERLGEILVQTYCPDHPVIHHLSDGTYENFLIKELSSRKSFGMAPYNRVCLLSISGVCNLSTSRTAIILASRISSVCEKMGWKLVGPTPATRIAGLSRWQILLQGSEYSSLSFIKEFQLNENIEKGVQLSIDPDPITL
uniref:DNA 3'-5' helicase n=1 Tax=Paulinella chromatophora TaxID=39717 RepID=B1X5Q1_PAUCH|nr:primosomal protein N' (replication factor Y) [Paulinella chromatophora]ACB43270.1 primosomal protein N' (replication factor Y) [Paulinella chromatophora]